jgi:hypothetical protein
MSSRRGRDADMAKSTPSDGPVTEPAPVYDAGERRTHAEHAAEAYDLAQRADAMYGGPEAVAARAQWHATMAIYEALTQPQSCRVDGFDQRERAVIANALDHIANLLLPIPDSPIARKLRDEFRA